MIPVFKKGDKSEPENYRPISILPIFSKIIETVFKKRMENFLTQCNILSTQQFGFRKNLSTTEALIGMINNILESHKNNIMFH